MHYILQFVSSLKIISNKKVKYLKAHSFEFSMLRIIPILASALCSHVATLSHCILFLVLVTYIKKLIDLRFILVFLKMLMCCHATIYRLVNSFLD